jgi:hypothetical protein
VQQIAQPFDGDFAFQVAAVNSAVFLDASVGVADRLSSSFEQGMISQAGVSERELVGCEIRPNFPGYRSDSITLAFRRARTIPTSV